MEDIEVLRTIFDSSGYKLAILKMLLAQPSVTNQEVASELFISDNLASRYIQHLYHGGLLLRGRLNKRIHYSLASPFHVQALVKDLEVLSHDCD